MQIQLKNKTNVKILNIIFYYQVSIGLPSTGNVVCIFCCMLLDSPYLLTAGSSDLVKLSPTISPFICSRASGGTT